MNLKKSKVTKEVKKKDKEEVKEAKVAIDETPAEYFKDFVYNK